MMRRFLFPAAAAFVASAAACPGLASAQVVAPPLDTTDYSSRAARAATPPPSMWDRWGQRGIELELGGMAQYGGGNSPVQSTTLWGAQGAGSSFARGTVLDPATAASLNPSQAYTPYSLDPFGLTARIGYRFRHQLSVGVFFSFAQYMANAGADSGVSPDSTYGLTRQQVTVGAYARYYFTQFHSHLQPWVLLGAGFDYDLAAYTRPVGQTTGMFSAQPETGNFILQQEGIVVPVAIGLDWRLAPVFSVGPTLGYAHVFPIKGCIEVDLDQYSTLAPQNTCSSPPVDNHAYDNFYAGIFAKVTFYPLTR